MRLPPGDCAWSEAAERLLQRCTRRVDRLVRQEMAAHGVLGVEHSEDVDDTRVEPADKLRADA